MSTDTSRNVARETRLDVATLLEMRIQDLVEQVPEAMGVLEPLGIDLCCGGGHPLGTALDLHGIDREPVVAEIKRLAADTPSATVTTG